MNRTIATLTILLILAAGIIPSVEAGPGHRKVARDHDKDKVVPHLDLMKVGTMSKLLLQFAF